MATSHDASGMMRSRGEHGVSAGGGLTVRVESTRTAMDAGGVLVASSCCCRPGDGSPFVLCLCFVWKRKRNN